MSFREPTLDDRTFQDLVSEARKRVSERCPEWTEHNLSDPGITLIETFAWMTEMLSYRLNRVPERVHLALLELLDIELKPPVAASTNLRFRLAEATHRAVDIPADETEVATAQSGGVVFRVRDDFTIKQLRPEVLVIQRQDPPGTLLTVVAEDGVVTPTGIEEPAFSIPPRPSRGDMPGDAFYLGFRNPLNCLVLRIDADVTRAHGVGIKPKDPPLKWQVSRSAGAALAAGGDVEGDVGWVDVEVLRDTTGGFNQGGGEIELQMPRRTAATTFANQHLHWVRCGVTAETRRGRPSPLYTQPPRIHRISAYPVGALVRAEAATTHVEEVLGESDGTPGQTFSLRNSPALELREGETLQVREPGAGHWVPWKRRDSFDKSDPDDRHFRFEPATGRIELGPAIRDPDRGWQQKGAVPSKGARLRMSRYRHGGGALGAMEANVLTELRNPIAGVASVTNPEPTKGGEDAETLGHARRRAAEELRTRHRAVTTEDFEYVAERWPTVKRARCLEPEAPRSAVRLYVLPAVDRERSAGPIAYDWLVPDEELLGEVARDINRRRTAGTSVHVMPVPVKAVTVVADVWIERLSRPDDVERAVLAALYRYVNPYVGGPGGGGWRFGAPLNEGDLHKVVHDVPGVHRVAELNMYETDPRRPGVPDPQPAGPRIGVDSNELLCSGTHRVRARRRLDDDDD